jgi:hypothetical protein
MKELSENEIQRAVFSHLRTRGAPGIFAFHPKNGSSDMRGRRRGVYAGLGVVPGIPDVIVFKKWSIHAPGGPTRTDVYALELKVLNLRDKKPTEHAEKQRECRERLVSVGVVAEVAYGLDEALSWLEEKGILRGEVK